MEASQSSPSHVRSWCSTLPCYLAMQLSSEATCMSPQRRCAVLIPELAWEAQPPLLCQVRLQRFCQWFDDPAADHTGRPFTDAWWATTANPTLKAGVHRTPSYAILRRPSAACLTHHSLTRVLPAPQVGQDTRSASPDTCRAAYPSVSKHRAAGRR